MRIPSWSMVLVAIVALAAGATGAEHRWCIACHATPSSWLSGRAERLERLAAHRDPLVVGHHWWFRPDALRALATTRPARNLGPGGVVEAPSFYETVRRLEDGIARDGGADADLQAWSSLMARGKDDVPGFGSIWQAGCDVVRRAPAVRQVEVRRVADALRRPYTAVHLTEGERLRFDCFQTVHVGRVLLFFGGMRKEYLGEATYGVQRRTADGYDMVTTYGARRKTPPLRAEFRVDDAGDLVSVSSYEPSTDCRLQNLTVFFERGGGRDFGTFSFDKVIYLQRRSRMVREAVRVRVDIQVEGLRTIGGEPCLEGRYHVQSHADSTGDAFALWGDGRFLHLPNGVVACQRSDLKFRIRLLGIPLVKGSVASGMWLLPDDGDDESPFDPTAQGW